MDLRRKTLAFRYMWTAWIALSRWLAFGVFLVFLAVAVVRREPEWLLPAGIALGAFLLLLVLFLFEAPRVRCLGCSGTLLRPMRCTKHPTAKVLLGSHVLQSTVALACYAKSVHCPYCGMRYRISRTTRADKRREEEEWEERRREERRQAEARERAEAEAENRPYY